MVEFDIIYRNIHLRICCNGEYENIIKNSFLNHVIISEAVGTPTYTLVISQNITNYSGNHYKLVDKWLDNATLDCYIDNTNRICYATNLSSKDNKHIKLQVEYFTANFFKRFLELSGYIGLHSSCVEKENQGILFVAERYNGKTICMLNMMNYGYNIVTNEITALKKIKDQLIGYGIAQDISIRLSHEFCKQDINQKYVDLASKKGISLLNKNSLDGDKLHISDIDLANLNNVAISMDASISSIIRPCYNPYIEHPIFEKLTKDQLRELLYSQYRTLVHETADYLSNIKISGVNEKQRYGTFDDIVSIPAYYCQQNEKTTLEFVKMIEKIRKMG